MAKILFADDDETLCDTATEWLKKESYTVDVAYNGLDALEHLKAYDYDAIVLDWAMPGANGLEICQQYRAAGGRTPLFDQ